MPRGLQCKTLWGTGRVLAKETKPTMHAGRSVMPAAPAGYVPEALEALTAPHIDSFDYFLSDGLRLVVQGLAPIEVSIVCPRSPTPS